MRVDRSKRPMNNGMHMIRLVATAARHHRYRSLIIMAVIIIMCSILVLLRSTRHSYRSNAIIKSITESMADRTSNNNKDNDAIIPFIYVYPLNDSYHARVLAANPECEQSMFGSEVAIHQSLLASPYRTLNPYEARLFYVPVYSSCYLTTLRVIDRAAKLDPHRWQRQIVMDAIHHINHHTIHTVPINAAGTNDTNNRTSMSWAWQRYHGANHVFTFSHDFGGCLSWRDDHKGGGVAIHSLLHHSIWLQPNGDYHPRASCYHPHRDIVIPPRHSLPLSLISRHDNRMANHDDWQATVYFRGTIDWIWHGNIDRAYSRGIRRKLADMYMNNAAYPNYQIIEGRAATLDQYTHELQHADFCLCPRGYAGWSPRLIDALLMACIPVVIADDTMLPYSSLIDWSTISIRISEHDATTPHRLHQLLSRYDYHSVRALQHRIRHLSIVLPSSYHRQPKRISLRDALTYLSSSPSLSSLPSPSSIDMIIAQLTEKSHLFEPLTSATHMTSSSSSPSLSLSQSSS